ncbi:hypothetical protein R1T43_16180 [Alteromonas sp. CI.11.F.A3]|uniref:hypothetical protein n=1 Tax=Alteromonas sp. CI.11.F.A3 TaxID=3079555 RepID=UPI0029422DE1|nr:hypothetical protein [Alteromonas sp. CI.11.F.A3]WOI36718.1 hypothetical protein R1T43_16180 [Alteromonas sp. CI.11.F.A3]
MSQDDFKDSLGQLKEENPSTGVRGEGKAGSITGMISAPDVLKWNYQRDKQGKRKR